MGRLGSGARVGDSFQIFSRGGIFGRDYLQEVISWHRSNTVNSLIATSKPQSNGPSYSNTVIGTLAVDGWAVTFGTARRGLGGAAARSGPSSLCQM